MDENDETAFTELGPMNISTSSQPPALQKRRNVPAPIRRMVLELGLRYRPINREAALDHSDAVDLLAEDVASIPPHLLEKAIAAWVRQSQFMPKASDLIRLSREELQAKAGPKNAADSYENVVILAHRYNARLAEQDSPLRWHIGPNNELRLAPLDEKPKYGAPLTRHELDNLTPDIVSMGLTYGFLERRNGQLVECEGK